MTYFILFRHVDSTRTKWTRSCRNNCGVWSKGRLWQKISAEFFQADFIFHCQNRKRIWEWWEENYFLLQLWLILYYSWLFQISFNDLLPTPLWHAHRNNEIGNRKKNVFGGFFNCWCSWKTKFLRHSKINVRIKAYMEISSIQTCIFYWNIQPECFLHLHIAITLGWQRLWVVTLYDSIRQYRGIRFFSAEQ